MPGIIHPESEGEDGNFPELHPAKKQQLEGRAAGPMAGVGNVSFAHTLGKCFSSLFIKFCKCQH